MNDDDGKEVEAPFQAAEIAADTPARENDGLRIVAMARLPLRHAAVAFGREGSGFSTKGRVLVAYGPKTPERCVDGGAGDRG